MYIYILTSNEVDSKPKLIKRNEEGHFIILLGIRHQQDIPITNIYALKNGASTYIKQILHNQELNRPQHNNTG